MNVTKRVFVLVLVFGMFCLFTSGALAIDVLYAPLEDFNNGTTTTVYVGEGSGTLEHCTVTGANPLITVIVSGKVGNALSFNGSRYIKVPHNSSLDFGTDDFAITFWVKTRSEKTNNTIIDKRKSSKTPGYHVTLYRGRPLLQMRDPNGGLNFWGGMNSKKVNDGEWHYVAIYVERDDEEGGKIYVDGLCEHTFDPTSLSGSLNSSVALLIGKHEEWKHAYFEGTLDELWIFRGFSNKAPLLKKR